MIKTFQEMGLPSSVLQALKGMKFDHPTPIQCEAIPPSLKGKDILATAQTGTGKTAAFGIPMIVSLLNNPKSHALVLAPTRELAMQIQTAIQQLARHSGFQTVLLIGGDSLPKQVSLLRSNPRIVIGTPGRVNDHLERGTLRVQNVHFLVLDETDRMLDMGFAYQLKRVISFIPVNHQTLMFSATLPKNILKVANEYLREPIRISVGSATKPVDAIEQKHLHVEADKKYTHLVEEIRQRSGSIVVFAKTKFGAEKLSKRLSKQNLEVQALHGGLRQNKREKVIAAFRKQKCRILVATDIAARGLDIPHVEHVINYDLPQCPEDYIHRIGRTARAGAQGFAMSFLTPTDHEKWNAICILLDPTKKAVKLSNARPKPLRRGGNRNRFASMALQPRLA